MKKTLATLLFVIASAVPVFGRVISYAPYSDQPSEAGVHLRTSRWFVLLEGADPDYRKVVLYDSRGEEEPRVVYTANHEQLWSAALREGAGAPPAIFVLGEYSSAISTDGGLTWKDVFINSEARPKFGIDTGGPFTGGLRNDVRIGNDSVPFVVATYVSNDYSDGVFSIDAEGEARQLPTWGSIIGQDRTGTYFLVESEWGGRIDLVDVWGNRWMRFVGDPHARFHTGWVSSRREVFIESRRYDGRHLYRYRQDRLEFIEIGRAHV